MCTTPWTSMVLEKNGKRESVSRGMKNHKTEDGYTIKWECDRIVPLLITSKNATYVLHQSRKMIEGYVLQPGDENGSKWVRHTESGNWFKAVVENNEKYVGYYSGEGHDVLTEHPKAMFNDDVEVIAKRLYDEVPGCNCSIEKISSLCEKTKYNFLEVKEIVIQLTDRGTRQRKREKEIAALSYSNSLDDPTVDETIIKYRKIDCHICDSPISFGDKNCSICAMPLDIPTFMLNPMKDLIRICDNIKMKSRAAQIPSSKTAEEMREAIRCEVLYIKVIEILSAAKIFIKTDLCKFFYISSRSDKLFALDNKIYKIQISQSHQAICVLSCPTDGVFESLLCQCRECQYTKSESTMYGLVCENLGVEKDVAMKFLYVVASVLYERNPTPCQIDKWYTDIQN